MIETRAILTKSMKFEGGFNLERGTVVYVRETADGYWLGMYYEPTGSGHGFALNPDQFSILTSSDIQSQEHVWMPDPPDPPEAVAERKEMERRRIESRIRRHREEADLMERLLMQPL